MAICHLGKGSGEKLVPLFFIGRDFFLGQEALVEHRGEGFLVHVFADQDDFLTAVSVVSLPAPAMWLVP